MAGVALLLYASFASAQLDLTGSWEQLAQQTHILIGQGPFPGDFAGIPLSKDGRAAAYAFNPEALEQLQRQCEPWSVQYLLYGPGGFTITTQRDANTGETVALHLNGSVDRMPMTIWLDGRSPPPPEVLHTFAGYTVGTWRGATLVTTTTDIKDGFLTRNGVPNSSRETLRMFMTRHGELLTITAIVHDPVYLTAAYPWAENYLLKTSGTVGFLPTSMLCLPEETVAGLSDGYHTSSYLPGQNPLTRYMDTNYGIPVDAAMGGERTMLPSYQRTIRGAYQHPSGYCKQYCCGADTFTQEVALPSPRPRGCTPEFN